MKNGIENLKKMVLHIKTSNIIHYLNVYTYIINQCVLQQMKTYISIRNVWHRYIFIRLISAYCSWWLLILEVETPDRRTYVCRSPAGYCNWWSIINLKTFLECSNNMEDDYKNVAEYNQSRRCNVLIVLNDMIADMINNKKCSPIVTELFIRKK